MDIQELFSRFAVALGIGLLIGLERGWTTRKEPAGSRTAGIRTFSIIGILGGTIGSIAQTVGGATAVGGAIVIAFCFAAFAAAITVFMRDENLAEKTFSATSAVAAMTTFALSAYAMVGDFRLAAAAAVVTAALLALREGIHGWIKGITWPELRSALVLLAMTFIVLPVIPNDPIGPFGGINPRDVWLIAIVLAGVAFLGYGAVKYMGARHGVLVAAAAGGLASSTAVVAANAKRAAAGEGTPRLLAAGVALANAISYLRVVAIVSALNPALLLVVAPPLVAAALVSAVFAVFSVYGRKEKAAREPMTLRNPFGFWAVVGFALLLVAIIFIGRALFELLGTAGLLIGALFLGLGDVDAVTVSMAQLPQQEGNAAALGILLAVLSNTVSKMAIGAGVGRGWFAIEIAAVSLASMVAGAVAFYATSTLLPAN